MSQLYEVCVPAAPLHRGGSRRSALETQLVYGEVFAADHEARGWAKGQAQSPVKGVSLGGYKGYIPLKLLRPFGTEPNVIVTTLSAPVFKGPDIKSPVQIILPMNARFRAQRSEGFFQTEIGYIHIRHARDIAQIVDVSDFVTLAERHLGRPYIWGGVVSDGLDCSGLVQASLRAAGIDAPRDAADQQHLGKPLPAGAPLIRGDLIFWAGHVGIMQDPETLLHANAYHMAVNSEPLGEAIARILESGGGPVTHRRRL